MKAIQSKCALRAALLTSAALMVLPAAAVAQSQDPESTTTVDEVVVTGIRATQRNSIAVKRDATVIVDAIVNEEIGALPDNSVGETLERITGVTADRFKGSASEISIRGLGPFLGFSTFNGREVSSGSGDRAVSFQQFPSELTSGVLVYKTQQADFIEGGVSGVIELRSLRPLDYGRRRFQAEARINYLPYAERAGADLGARFAASFVDQFQTGIGDVGVAIGIATTDTSAPEDFYTTSSSYRPCNSVNTTPNNVSGGSTGNCSYLATRTTPTYFVPNGYNFRQLVTEDTRRALTGNLQWRPNDRWDLNLDVQLSTRESFEDRHDLSIAEGRRGVAPQEVAPNGALLRYAANSYLESVASERQRDEDYAGGGLSIAYQATDDLRVTADLSYSRTHREQLDFATRLRSNTIFGPSGRVAYTFDQTTSDIPVVNFVLPIDLNNHDAFTGNAYARRGLEDRVDEIGAARVDFIHDRDGVFEEIRFGLRYSDHSRVTDLDNDNNLETIPTALALAGNQNCRIDNVVENWGEDSGTNITSWAQFDTRCLYLNFTGSDDLGPLADPRSASDLDISERIAAAYVMGSFRTEIGGTPITGNIGLRYVSTDVTSRGFRGAYTLVTTVDPITMVPSYRLDPVPGSFDEVEISSSYENWLPSLNFNAEVRENLYLRGGVYRAISRTNIEDLGAGRTLITDGQQATPQDALAGASGGNPRLRPLEAWN
jgi:iron complex outermembrane recepter protein